MTKLGPLVPLAGLSAGVRRVEEADRDDQVYVVASKMCHLYNLEKSSIEHTWYGDTSSNIRSCARSGQQNKVFILVNKRTIVTAETDRNKLEDCVKLELNADVSDVVNVDGTVWIIFSNGGVRQLEYYQSEDEEDWESVEDVVDGGETVLESVVTSGESGQWSVTHLLQSRDQGLGVMRGRVVLDTVTRVHSLVDTLTTSLQLTRADAVTWHLDSWSQLYMITTQDSLVSIDSVTGAATELTSVASGSKHVSLCHVSRDQLAVIGTLSEGGYLHTVSTTYTCVTGQCKLKTSAHNDKGLHLIIKKLYLIISNKVMSVSPNCGDLESVLGSQADPAQMMEAQLNDNILSQADMPEYLIVQCINKLLAGDYTEERQGEVVKQLVKHNISQTVMNELITDDLSLENVIK